MYDYVEPFHHDANLRGVNVAYELRVAEVTVGSVTFVLVEPLKGPSPWREFVDTQGEGLVSIGVSFDTVEKAETVRKEFEKLGVGRVGERANR